MQEAPPAASSGVVPCAGHLQQRILINSAAIIVSRASLALISFLIVPLLIRYLGLAGFGAWETIYSIAAFFMVLAQGLLGTTMSWRMSFFFGREDPAAIRRLARIGATVPLALTLLLGPAIWVFRRPVVQALHLPGALESPALVIFPVVVGLTLLYGLVEIWGAVTTSFQQAGLTTILQTGARILFYLSAAAGLMAGAGLWGMLVAFVVFMAFSLVGTYLAARRNCVSLDILPTLPSPEERRVLTRYAALMIVGTLTWAFRAYLQKILLAAVESAEWVAYFAVANLLAVAVYEVCGFFSTPTVAAVGALHGRRDEEGIKRIYGNMMSLVIFFAGLVGVVILGFFDRILVLWMGRVIPQTVSMLILLVAGNLVAVALTGAGTAVCRGIGRAEIETRYMVVNLALNILFILILMARLGGMGVVIAGSLSWALAAVFFLISLHRRLAWPWRISLRPLSGLPAVGIIIAGSRVVLGRIPEAMGRLAALRELLVFGALALAGYGLLMSLNPVFRKPALAATRHFLAERRRGVRP